MEDVEGDTFLMARCPGCQKRTQSRVIAGTRVIVLCQSCTTEAEEAKKLAESCPHPGVRNGTCTACGSLKCDDGGWETPMRRPRIRRVV